MKPEGSARCLQTLSSWVGSGDETTHNVGFHILGLSQPGDLVPFFKCRADKSHTFSFFNNFKWFFTSHTTDCFRSFSARNSSKKGSSSFDRLAAISDLPLGVRLQEYLLHSSRNTIFVNTWIIQYCIIHTQHVKNFT